MKEKLNREEHDLLRSFDRGEWKSIPDGKKEISRHKSCAKAAMKKDRNINIRIADQDLESLHRTAEEEGVPYQTLISSILHKYVTGKLVDRGKSSPEK